MKVRTLARPLVMVAATLALLAVLPVSPAALAQPAQTIKLKLADTYPTTHFIANQVIKPWMARVTQLSKTKVEFQHFPSEQLAKRADMLNVLQNGVADIIEVAPTGDSGNFPLHTFFYLAGLFGDSIEGTRIYLQMMKEGPLLEEWTKKGIRPLTAWAMPTYEIFTVKKPILKVEDIKGLKIRASGGYMGKVVEVLGAVPVQIVATEINTALDRGTVDGASFAYVSAISYKLQDQVKYATLGARLSSSVPGMGILERTWQKLPADVRDAMTKANAEFTTSVTKWQEDETMNIVSTFKKAGVQVNQLPKDEVERWAKACAPLTEQWVKDMEAKRLPGKWVFDAYKKAAAGR